MVAAAARHGGTSRSRLFFQQGVALALMYLIGLELARAREKLPRYEIEFIHPFSDGNASLRIARFLRDRYAAQRRGAIIATESFS